MTSCDLGAEGASTRSLVPPRIVDGVEIYVDDPSLTSHDEVGHDHSHAQKDAQARHFDQLAQQEFEIERPHGSSRLYGFLLGQKFSRAVRPIRGQLNGSTALVVCGGSGMDAEFFARDGAIVINSDLSLGAALRAKERSARYKLPIRSIVADVERLPFADESVDIVAVHDGLHHLDDPYAGLAEMARVARRWVVVSEPARALVTQFAIRLGIALETEEAGNRVERLEPVEVASFLAARGFTVLRAQRYAMYYPHAPGRAFAVLSLPLIYQLVRVSWLAANLVIGPMGNKMVVVAERRQSLEGSQTLPRP